MAKTRHIEKRMKERGIKDCLLGTVEKFGVWSGDKLILNRKGASAAVNELDRIRRRLIDIEGKGGIVLVEAKGMDITTYALGSYRRGKKK